MAIVYVASSKGLANWGADHGLTKHCYKIGVTDGTAEAAVEALNVGEHAGHADWKLAKQAETDEDEAAILARVGAKEKLVDPNYYPGIKKAPGIGVTLPQLPQEVEREEDFHRSGQGDTDARGGGYLFVVSCSCNHELVL